MAAIPPAAAAPIWPAGQEEAALCHEPNARYEMALEHYEHHRRIWGRGAYPEAGTLKKGGEDGGESRK